MGTFLLPFIIGFIFAMLIRSFVRFIEDVTGMNSKISAGICTAMCYVLIFLLIYFTVRLFTGEIIRFFDNLPQLYETKIAPTIKKIEQLISGFGGKNSEFEKMITSFLIGAENELSAFFKTLSGNAAESLAKLLLKIPDLLVTITVTIVSSFFISIDYTAINDFFLSQLKPKTRERFTQIKEVFFKSVSRICVSYFLIFLITFAELSVGLFLLRVKHPLVISMVIAVADIFPVIGTGTILIPWSMIELLNGNKPLALGIFVLFLIISVVRNIIEPKIIGKNSGIHPVATMVAMYVGLKLGGVVCAVALPFVIIILKELNDKNIITIYRRADG
ncbi:MAG: sporulation integral membrane protein YtvI [Oscillospiraceae bacterium]|nr:sporulation integral membrane protein YtvI [Oscillospiraceae bacterium]